MVKVNSQFRTHPLYTVLSQAVDSQVDITHTNTRKRPRTRSTFPVSQLTQLAQAIFAHCVTLWNALPEEAKEWYNENAPPEFCTGYLWWTWSCLIKNYGAGPWTVNSSKVGGHCYITPKGAPQGIYALGYTGATEVGTLAHVDWEPGCPEENLPLLLVHGWYPEAFDPADTWRTMTLALTSLDPIVAENYVLVYDPEHPGDPSYALKCLDGDGRTLYISNYTHNPGAGTPGDIRQYAQSLRRELEVAREHRGAPAVDILTHSMGALVARAYIENEDLTGNPYPAPYQGDVRMLIMLAPPNQGAYFNILYPGWWDWTSVIQMMHGSEFLSQLNGGTTGDPKDVEYHIIAGNLYDCSLMEAYAICFLLEWLNNLGGPEIWAARTEWPYHATRLCEYTDGKINDGEILTRDAALSEQASRPEVIPDRYHVDGWDHWEIRGRVIEKCEAATLVRIILAKYDLSKWRSKGKDIEPPEMSWIQHALYKIKKSKTALPIYNYIVDHDIKVEAQELMEGTLAVWSEDANTIFIDPSAEAELAKVVAQYIVHEGEHARWKAWNSIIQEYSAYKAETDFWKEVKGGDTDDHCDFWAGIIAQGRQYAMNFLKSYPHYSTLPVYSETPEELWDICETLLNLQGGYTLFIPIQRRGVGFNFAENERGAFAWYWPEHKQGSINPELAMEDPRVLASYMAYLCMRASWDCQDSIHQEKTCFQHMARVWSLIRGTLKHEFLDFVKVLVGTGESALIYWLSEQPEYADLLFYYP